MKSDEFRRLIKKEFGNHLEHATPANVREFLDRVQEDVFLGQLRAPIELREEKTTYEEILRDFFARVLDFPPEEALVMLWTMAFDLSFTTLELHLSERLDHLFQDKE